MTVRKGEKVEDRGAYSSKQEEEKVEDRGGHSPTTAIDWDFSSNNFVIDGEESSLEDADSSFRVYGLWFEQTKNTLGL